MRPPPILNRIHSQLSSIRNDRTLPIPAQYYHGNDRPNLTSLPSCLLRSPTVSSSRRPSSSSSSSSSSPNNRNSSRTIAASPTNKSTGISYLDTWMNNPSTTTTTTTTTTAANGKRLVEPTAMSATTSGSSSRRLSPLYQLPSPSLPPPPPASVPQTNNSYGRLNPLPSSAYQMFMLRPTRTDTPKSLLERLNHQIKQQQRQRQPPPTVDESSSKIIMPLVLDLSDLHSNTGLPHGHDASVAPGTLTEFVNAIRSHRNRTTSNSMEHQSIGYSLVGIANLPPGDTLVAEEAQMSNLPLLYNTQNINPDSNAGSSSAATAAGAAVLHDRKPVKRTIKKRGGVAPLLRQRRPGVAASSIGKSIRGDVTNSSSATAASSSPSSSSAASSSSTLTTKIEASATQTDVQIVGTGKLLLHAIEPPRNNTKVHKGSVRSGQLLSSDRPHQSLVIVGSVNPGGEVWSEGDVYVFGKLRGRVLAGLSNVGGGGVGGGGNDSRTVEGDDGVTTRRNEKRTDDPPPRSSGGSRIFATSFDPELVCIGDVFKTMEDDVAESCGLEEGAGPAMVTVDEGTGELVFERMEL